jgi:hypothetical protein
MKTEAKSLLLLLGTMSLGVLLGAAGNGTVQRERREQADEIRQPGGFVEHMMAVIRPKDEAQRSAILPLVQAAGTRNEAIMRTAHTQLRAALDSMRTRLAPRLDAEQRARLEEFARMAPPPGPGGPHHGGPGMHGGPPHDGWGPPPPPRDGDGPPRPPRDGWGPPPPPRNGDGPPRPPRDGDGPPPPPGAAGDARPGASSGQPAPPARP